MSSPYETRCARSKGDPQSKEGTMRGSRFSGTSKTQTDSRHCDRRRSVPKTQRKECAAPLRNTAGQSLNTTKDSKGKFSRLGREGGVGLPQDEMFREKKKKKPRIKSSQSNENENLYRSLFQWDISDAGEKFETAFSIRIRTKRERAFLGERMWRTTFYTDTL